jgi:hypothetical protein
MSDRARSFPTTKKCNPDEVIVPDLVMKEQTDRIGGKAGL